jgi:purine-binding chemotaxis protein CheW
MDATVRLLVFSLDDTRYALHLSQVDRVIRSVDCTPLPEAPQLAMGMIDVRGTLVPVLSIRSRFGLPQREIGPDDHFIIAQASHRTVALIVDNVSGIIERPACDIVAPERILPRLEQIDGVIQLEDGLVLIRDLSQFLSLEEEHALENAMTRQLIHGI